MRGWRLTSLVAFCSLVLACTVDSDERDRTESAALPPTSEPSGDTQREAVWKRVVRNSKVGYSLFYPEGWSVTGQVVATEFAVDAPCRSVRVVDFEPPPDAGPGAEVLQSFVQVCWKPLSDGSTLHEFMRSTYGAAYLELFRRLELGGVLAYRRSEGGGSTTTFLQTGEHRIQVVSAVRAAPDKRAKRLMETGRVLARLVLAR